jgi:hypothetical protein
MHEAKHPFWRQRPCSGSTVIKNIPAQLHPGASTLRMWRDQAHPNRRVRGAPGHQVKAPPRRLILSKVLVNRRYPLRQRVVLDRCPSQRVAPLLHLHHRQVCILRHGMQSHQPDGANSSPNVKQPPGTGARLNGNAGHQQIIRREPVPLPELIDVPGTNDLVKCDRLIQLSGELFASQNRLRFFIRRSAA